MKEAFAALEMASVKYSAAKVQLTF